MFSLLPMAFSIVLMFGGGDGSTVSNADLGYDTQQMDTTNISSETDDTAPIECTTLCKGPDEQ